MYFLLTRRREILHIVYLRRSFSVVDEEFVYLPNVVVDSFAAVSLLDGDGAATHLCLYYYIRIHNT